MALIHIGFFSESLGMQVSCDVILPEKQREPGELFPVLWLLHGMSDDHTIWQRRTSIERYVTPLNLAVVMPAAQISSYANMVHGGRYYDYIAKELPAVMRGFFPLSDKREDNFIAGLSMGGAGSFKIGLANPESYAAIGCLSAAYKQGLFPNHNRPEMQKRREKTFGDRDLTGTEEDVEYNVERILKEKLPLPRIYHACGTEDFVIEGARKTRDYFMAIEGNPFDYTYEEAPGTHNWDFWDEYIQRFLGFLKI
jgi:S-formylglutathione hydrolase FrmB